MRVPLTSLPAFEGMSISTEPPPLFTQSGPSPDQVVEPSPQSPRAFTKPRLSMAGVDWPLVYRIRKRVASQVAERLKSLGEGVDAATEVQIGRSLIPDIVVDYQNDAVESGRRADQIDPTDIPVYQRAVDSAMYGYGRWQPLMDDPDVENIEIRGYKNVFMVYADRIDKVAPVADSDEELVEQLQFIATYASHPKPFSQAHPSMTLNLDDKFRLHAYAFDVVDRPHIVIRQHKHPQVTLPELADLGMMPPRVADFLGAVVRAKRSIMVSGIGGVGKTTFVRGLVSAIPARSEAIGLIETDPELFLHKIPDLGERIISLRAREGSSEGGYNPSGRPIGEVTVADHIVGSMRQNLGRIVVGEVLGAEAAAMFQAMQYGAGSLSTIHAHHAQASIERLVTAAALGGSMTHADAYRQTAVNMHLLIHISARDERSTGGRYHRFVNEIVEISGFSESRTGTPGYLPATAQLYSAHDPDRPLAEHMSPQMFDALRAEGWVPS